MYEETWSAIKKQTCLSPEQFMSALRIIVPNLHVEHLIKVKRTERNNPWVHEVCDFIWVCMQENRDYWQPQIDRLWPSIKLIMEQQKLEDAFSQLHF